MVTQSSAQSTPQAVTIKSGKPGCADASGYVFDTPDALRTYLNDARAIQDRALLATLGTGDTSLVPRSDKLMGEIEAQRVEAPAGYETQRCVAGGLADVPAYLSGSPVNMRRRQPRVTLAPIKLVCDLGASGATSAAQIERRGVATLALLRLLEQSGYPVELYLVSGTILRPHTTFISVKVETRPLDLARACWQLSSERYYRDLTWAAHAKAVNRSNTAGINWAWDATNNWAIDLDWQVHVYSQLLSVDPSEIMVIRPLLASSPDFKAFDNDQSAAQWVSKTYAEAVARASSLNE